MRFRQFVSQRCNWHTPSTLYDALNAEFHFDDDPCPEGGMFGLDRSWGKSTFCNPPYGPSIRKWLEKGVAEFKAGKRVVFLLPARTDTRWFHEIILPNEPEIRFIKGRLHFGGPLSNSGRAPFPSIIVIFGQPVDTAAEARA